MSIKKLFNSTNKDRNYLSDTDRKDAFQDVESGDNVQQISEKQNKFIPQIDFSEPENFVKYGSAYLYYKGAIEHVYDYYPYDGSDTEVNKFNNELLDVERFIFDNDYPRTNGYAKLSADGWGTLNGSIDTGYGLPNTLEYITFFGGPNTSSYTKLAQAFSNPTDSKYQHSNIYDTDIYTTAGEPSDYGTGTRQSNLQSNFDTGVTIEFWLQKDGFSNSLTEKEVVFDMWNNAASGSVDYARMRVELTGAATGSPFLITALSGTSGIYQQSIGADLTTGSLTSFGHYAFTFYNDGSDFITKLYVNGALNATNGVSSLTISELNSKDMVGRLGSLLTASASPTGPVGQTYAGKLSGSLDEFRFWKVRRNSEQISNVLAGAATKEYLDPIIYSTHPSVVSLKDTLTTKGKKYDLQNNNKFVNLIPSWLSQDQEDDLTNIKILSHIIGSYFDKLYLQISSLTQFLG